MICVGPGFAACLTDCCRGIVSETIRSHSKRQGQVSIGALTYTVQLSC